MSDNQRLTKNQKVVLQALSKARKPMSAYEVLEQSKVRAQGLTAPVTIYRALDKLQALELVHRIDSMNAYVACNQGPHDEPVVFMICRDCRKTVELHARECGEMLTKLASDAAFQVANIKIEVAGTCNACQSH